jgi:hypothetical protein
MDGMGETLGDSTGRQNPKFQTWRVAFQRRELNGGRQGVDRIQGAVDSEEGAGAREWNAQQRPLQQVHALVHHCEPPCFMRPIGKGVRTKRWRAASNWARHHCIFGHVPRNNPFLYILNDRSATWIRLLIAINFLRRASTVVKETVPTGYLPRCGISSPLLTRTR